MDYVKKILNFIWSTIARIVAGLNKKYDSMKEPARFYTMLCIAILPWLIMDILAMISGHVGFDAFALMWVFFLIVIRIWWIEGNLQKYLKTDIR